MLRVNEIFATIQGEATWTGMPATFIRLQGCPVACSWCDTKHTWPNGSERTRVGIAEMLNKEDPSSEWAEMTSADVVGVVSNMEPRHFVITGGEPLAQDIKQLTADLLKIGTVQVETSGTCEPSVASGVWVTVSPKIDMSGGLKVLPRALSSASEIKMPIACERDIENLLCLLKDCDTRASVWLQPVSQSHEMTNLCIQNCLKYGWRLSIQTHKYAGLR